MNIIKRNTENKTVTAELSWDELDHYINEYDKIAGRYLRHNNLEKAVWWANLSKELQETKNAVLGKK